MEKEERLSSRFICKPIIVLHSDTSFGFNGGVISHKSGGIYLSQSKHVSKMSMISEDSGKVTAFVAQRARGAYIASVCRPEITYGFSVSAQVTSLCKSPSHTLNKLIKIWKENPHLGIRFVPLEMQTIRVIVFVDASFTSNEDLTSQHGFLICLADGKSNANIVHYSSLKSKRITRRVLAAELCALIHEFDSASPICKPIFLMFDRIVSLSVCIDLKSLFDAIVGIHPTTEKRLLIDLSLLREAFEMCETDNFFRIPSQENPADALTKKSP